MDVIISDHAAAELVRRGIPTELLRATLEQPQQKLEAEHGRAVYQSRYFDTVENKPMLLRVVVEPRVDAVRRYCVQDVPHHEILGGGAIVKIIYDPETDTLSLLLREGTVSESDELRDGIIVDYDREGQIMGFEVLDASRFIADPQNIVYQVKGRLTPASRP